MSFLLAAFMAAFALLHLAMLSVEFFLTPASERDPLLESVADGLIALILLLGMIFLYREVKSPGLKLLWAFIAPATCAVQFWLSWKARSRDSHQKPEGLPSSSRWFADVSTLALYVPAMVLNCLFAFGA